MIKNLTCIECPQGCLLSVDVENCRVAKVSGNKCPKGIGYAMTEIENPVRILTSAVLAEGLGIRMVPVRTDKPIPKSKLKEAMDRIRGMRIMTRVRAGGVIVKDFVEPGVNLIATRDAGD